MEWFRTNSLSRIGAIQTGRLGPFGWPRPLWKCSKAPGGAGGWPPGPLLNLVLVLVLVGSSRTTRGSMLGVTSLLRNELRPEVESKIALLGQQQAVQAEERPLPKCSVPSSSHLQAFIACQIVSMSAQPVQSVRQSVSPVSPVSPPARQSAFFLQPEIPDCNDKSRSSKCEQ